MSVAAQAELITDDPRCGESVSDVLREWKRFRQLCKEHGGLMTSGQAAKIIGVPPGQISVWCSRGRLTSFEVLGARMVAAPEVLALYKERAEEGIRNGAGRGVKAPSLAELARVCWDDYTDAGI